jgi:hypothetical protein
MENFEIYLIILAVVIGILIYLWSENKINLNLSLPKTKLPNLNIKFWKVINFLGWLIFLVAVPVMFAPEFWDRFYNYQYFWLVMAILAFAVFMYSYHSYIRWLWAIIIIIILVIANFGNFSFFKKDKKEVHVTIEDKPTGQKWYLTLTQDKPYWQGSFPSSDMDITPDCDGNIIVLGDTWAKSETLYGCTKGVVEWPMYKRWIRISILQ